MKRFFWILLLFGMITGPVLSQVIHMKDEPDELYFLANQLFWEKEYPGSYRTISTWFERSENPALLEDASFLRARVAYELNKRDASLLLIQFIKDFPLSDKLPKAYYLLGCTALNAEYFSDALKFFGFCPESSLAETEVDEYRFRYAYAALQNKDFETARRLFANVTAGTSRYIPSATYFLAYMDYADGKIQAASDGFEKVGDQIQYQNVTEYFKLQLLYIDGKYDEMIQRAEALLEKKPTVEQKTELVRLLGAAWFDKKKHMLSQQYYQEYLAMAPTIGRSDLYRIGINYYNQRNYPASINYLIQSSGKEDAMSQSATFHVGLCYLKQNKKDQARMSFEQASLQNFDKQTQEKALYNYALICYEEAYSPFNEQAKAFQKLLTEFPNSTFTTSANNYLSEVFLSSKDYSGSLAFIETLISPEPKMLQTKTRLLFLSGVEKYNTQNYSEALQLFTKAALLAVENNFPSSELFYWKGETNYKLGYLKEATEDFLNFTNDPNSSKNNASKLVAYQLGYSYFKQGLYDDARIWFEKFTAQKDVKKEKTYTDALNRIGDSYFQAKDTTKAEKAYQLAQTSQVTGNEYATYQLAICQGARKLYKAKTEILADFDRKFPKSIYLEKSLYELAVTYTLLNQTEDATLSYDKLLKTFPDSPLSRKSHLMMADLLKEQDRTEEAVTAYKKVIELYPSSEEAQHALEGLKSILVKNKNRGIDYLNYTAGLRGIVKIETGEEDTIAFQSAEIAFNANNTAEAITGYQYYLEHFSVGAFRDESHFKLGRLQLSAGRIQDGLNELDSLATKTGSKYQVPAVMLLAEGYVASKNFAMALNAYQQLENLASDRSTRQTAVMGIIRSSFALELYKNAVDASNRMLNDENPGTDLQRETMYYKAMSLLKDEQTELAINELRILGAETYAALGAEARFRLAECLYDEGNTTEAETEIRTFLKEGTPHSYWLARASILLCDICIKQGKDMEARQYLMSLKQNYKVNNDIQELITVRSNVLSKRSN